MADFHVEMAMAAPDMIAVVSLLSIPVFAVAVIDCCYCCCY